jgi:hypothetical protein
MEKQFIKLRRGNQSDCTIWKPYVIGYEPGFVYLDAVKLQAHAEHWRLFTGAVAGAVHSGKKEFGDVPAVRPQERVVRLPLITEAEVAARLEHCLGPAHPECRGFLEGKAVCLDVQKTHPGHAYIESGVCRPYVSCPRGYWGQTAGALARPLGATLRGGKAEGLPNASEGAETPQRSS